MKSLGEIPMEYKILLLEDDVSLIDGLTYSLQKNGYTIDVAQSVRKAYEYFAAGDLLSSFF